MNVPDHECLNQICDIVASFGLVGIQQFKFDDMKFAGAYDVCVQDENGNPRILFEYDGWMHYDAEKLISSGISSGNIEKHLAEHAVSDVKKIFIAYIHNVPCIRLNKLHLDELEYIVTSAVHYFVLDDFNIKDGAKKLKKQWFVFEQDSAEDNEDGDGVETDSEWVHMRWTYKEWTKDNSIMPELIGQPAKVICDIINTAFPRMCIETPGGVRRVKPVHLYRWKADCAGEPSKHDISKIQTTIDTIRSEAKRRNLK